MNKINSHTAFKLYEAKRVLSPQNGHKTQFVLFPFFRTLNTFVSRNRNRNRITLHCLSESNKHEVFTPNLKPTILMDDFVADNLLKLLSTYLSHPQPPATTPNHP